MNRLRRILSVSSATSFACRVPRRRFRCAGLAKKALLALLGAGLAGSASGALDVSQNVGRGSSDTFFNTELANNSGVEYDSATLDYSQPLFKLANLSWKVNEYDSDNDGTVSLGEFIPAAKNDGYLVFTLGTTGSVFDGWNGNIGNDGVVDITGNGFEEAWNDGGNMDTTLSMDNQLYTDPADGTVVGASLDPTETVADFATADDLNINTPTFTSDGVGYTVPEPGAYAALAGALALGAAAVCRRRKKEYDFILSVN